MTSAGDCPECKQGKHPNCTHEHIYGGEIIEGCVCEMRHHEV